MSSIDRENSLKLLEEYTRTAGLRKHALAVEASMRAYARMFGEDEDLWGIVGLLHDFDYERFPDDHPEKGSEILAERGYPEEIRRAILGHVPNMNVPRDTKMAKTLFACDELSGFIVACALVRPNRLNDLKVSSVRKKMKDKAFARGVSRDDIAQGSAELGVDLDRHIEFLIRTLASRADELGL